MFKFYELISRIMAKGINVGYGCEEDNLVFISLAFVADDQQQVVNRSHRR